MFVPPGPYYASTTDGKKWTSAQKIPDKKMGEGLAATILNNKLYIMWQASDGTRDIYYASTNGTKWDAGKTQKATKSALAASTLNDKLYLMWEANDDSRDIYYCSN